MRFSIVTIVALASTAFAAPAPETNAVDFHLPAGCKKSHIAECIFDLAKTGFSCATAIAQVLADPIADLGCITSAASAGKDIHKCKACVTHKTNVHEG